MYHIAVYLSLFIYTKIINFTLFLAFCRVKNEIYFALPAIFFHSAERVRMSCVFQHYHGAMFSVPKAVT